jgi:uncharacterized protein (TIGR03437 family)
MPTNNWSRLVPKSFRTAVQVMFLFTLGMGAQAATTFWAGTTAGLLKSMDGGVSWHPVTVTTSNSLLHGNIHINAIALDPQQADVIYFVGNSDSATGFYRSNDGGATWTGITLIGVVAGPGSTWLAVDPVLTNVIYLGGGGKLHQSTDFGTTWKLASLPNLPASAGGTPAAVGGLSIDPTASGTLYVSNSAFIFKSTDFGSTWTTLARIATTFDSPAAGNVIVDPRNSNTLYVGDDYPFVNGNCGTALDNHECGLFKSTDGGQSWANVAPAGIYTEVVFDARNSNLYVGANVTGVGGGVLKSTDGGNTWNPVNNTVTRNLLFPDPAAANTMVAFNPFGAAANVYRSTDAGATWTQINLQAVPIGNGSSAFPDVQCMAVAKPLQNVSAATFESGPVTAESIVSALGFDLATASAPATSQPPPTNLTGTTVTVVDSQGSSRLAPLFYVSPGQVNYEIPAGTAAGVAIVTVKSGDGVESRAPLGIAAVAPSLFILSPTGLAAAYALQILNGNQTYENVYQAGASNTVIPLPINLGLAGEQLYLLLYGTGLRKATNFSATVGGTSVPVISAGAQGEFLGEDQVNVGPLPLSLVGRGNVSIVLTADGITANVVNVSIQ